MASNSLNYPELTFLCGDFINYHKNILYHTLNQNVT